MNAPPVQEQPLDPTVKGAHDKAAALFREYEIDPRAFTEYGTEEIERDIAYVARREASFERDANTPFAEIFEGIVFEQGEQSDWFGKNARTIKTSRYDDIVNKADLLVELEHQDGATPSPLSLAIDVTFSTREEPLDKKFALIQENIDKGTLGSIKYFTSEGIDFHGALRRVPQVVIGTERDTVGRLAYEWMREDKKARNEFFRTHPIQNLILAEMKEELAAFRAYAKASGNEALEEKFDQEYKKVITIIREKEVKGLQGIEDDRVLAALRAALERFAVPA